MRAKSVLYAYCLLIAALLLATSSGCWKKPELQTVNPTRYLDVKEDQQEELWELIRIKNEVVGYRNTVIERFSEEGKTVYQVTQETMIADNRLGNRVSGSIMTIVQQKRDGTFLLGDKYESLSGQPMVTRFRPDEESDNMIRWASAVMIDQASGEETTGTDPSIKKLPWKTGTSGEFGVLFSLWEKPLTPGEKRIFEYFDMTLEQLVTVELVAGKIEPLLYNNAETYLLPVAETTRIGKTVLTSHLWMDAGGSIVKAAMTDPYPMEITLSTREKAKSAFANAGKLNLSLFALVRVQGTIPQPRTTQKVELRLHWVNQNAQNASATPFATLFPETAFQSVSVVDGNTLTMTVTASTPQALSALYGSVIPPTPKETTVPGDVQRNEWVQSDSDTIKTLADEATDRKNPIWEVAADLERFVSQKMRRVSYQQSFASAAEVAETLQGDSAGYAVLLAAVARAKNIPSRVVVGLVYTETNMSEGVFVPHFWTELYIDGHWHPFDATITRTTGQGGADASRIVLARSNLADESLPSLAAKTLPLIGHLQVTVVTTMGD